MGRLRLLFCPYINLSYLFYDFRDANRLHVYEGRNQRKKLKTFFGLLTKKKMFKCYPICTGLTHVHQHGGEEGSVGCFV